MSNLTLYFNKNTKIKILFLDRVLQTKSGSEVDHCKILDPGQRFSIYIFIFIYSQFVYCEAIYLQLIHARTGTRFHTDSNPSPILKNFSINRKKRSNV